MTQNDTRASSFSFTVTNFDQKSPKMIANKIEATPILKFTELKHNLKVSQKITQKVTSRIAPKITPKIVKKSAKIRFKKSPEESAQNIGSEIDPKVA